MTKPVDRIYKCGWCSDGFHHQCKKHISVTRKEGKTEYTKEWTCQCSHES